MKANLMFDEGWIGEESEFRLAPGDLRADLELVHILEHMAAGDKAIYNACEDVLLHPLQSAEAIIYRQETFADAIKNPDVVRRLYAIAAESERIKGSYMSSTRLADSFANVVELLKIYTRLLKDLREVADKKLPNFKSKGFKTLLEMFQRELTDEYFSEVYNNLREINNVDNILISAKLGNQLQSIEYTLRRKEKNFRLRWCMATSFTADAERNPNEIDDLFNRRERAISEATSILAQSAKYLEGFFDMLSKELAFYVGCLNLTDEIHKLGMPCCIPVLLPMDSTERSWFGLYDISLVLMTGAAAVTNDLEATGNRLYIITGANQGGKSTFLRSVGQAQLMAQCGMPVGAESFAAPIRCGLFTHFKREEDIFMRSGKLEEELSRMNVILDNIKPGSMIMLNESLSSTNEREGSEICRQITSALVDSGVEVFSVTHMYTYAVSFLEDNQALFLRAQRRDDAERTFKILPGDPLETAYGEDLYKKIFVKEGRTLGGNTEITTGAI